MEIELGISVHQHYLLNRHGRDFFVGDIHGKLDIFFQLLRHIGFKTYKDRLFSTGDLIDRGEDSYLCLLQSRREWLIPVLGNHELFLLQCADYESQHESMAWQFNGGAWWQALTAEEKIIAKTCVLENFHLTLSVDTVLGKIGIVHAQYPLKNWPMTIDDINQTNVFQLMWDREIIEHDKDAYFSGIDLLISGHTPVKQPLLKGQQLFIDTGSGHSPNHIIDNPRITICEPRARGMYLHSFNGKRYQVGNIYIK